MEKYVQSKIYFILVLIFGVIHVSASISICAILFSKKEKWYKAILNKLFFNKQFSWWIFLTSDFIIVLFVKTLKCSSDFGLQIVWESESKSTYSLCSTSTGSDYMPGGVWALLGIVFQLCLLVNVTIYLGFSSNLRLIHPKKGMNTVRRNVVPEITRIWMFWVYYLLSDIKNGSFLMLLIPVVCHLSMIYSTLYSGSFVSIAHRYIQLTVYLTSLWFILGKYSDYVIQLINYRIDYPLSIFFFGYLALLITIISKKKSKPIEDSFKSIHTYGKHEDEKLALSLENLVLLYKGSESSTKDRVLLLGYVTDYQLQFDSQYNSMINFSRLSRRSLSVAPEKYYVNLRDGFEKHISS
jgi:hypothetical protein